MACTFPRALFPLGLLGLCLLAACGGGGSGSSPALGGPTNLSVQWSPVYSNYVDISWTAPLDTIDGYQLEERNGSAAFTLLNTNGLLDYRSVATGWSVNTASLAEDSNLDFRMRAFKGSGSSAYSNTASLHMGLKAPGFTNVTYSSAGVDVSWTNYSTVADTLLLERGIFAPASSTYTWTTVPGITFGAVHYLDPNPPEEATVAYRATYSKGAETVSSISYTVSVGLKAPVNLQAVPLVEGVNLTWQNQSTSATEVVVCRASGLDAYPSYQDLAHLAPGATSYQDLALAMGYYTYRIDARGPNYQTSSSKGVMAVTLPLPGTGPTLAPRLISQPAATGGAMNGSQQWFLAQDSSYNSGPVTIQSPDGAGWTPYLPPNATSLLAPKILLDSLGHPHTVFLRSVVQGGSVQAIVHAWFDGTAWQTEEVARRTLYNTSSATGPAFQLDGADNLKLLWLNSLGTPAGLEYAYKGTGGAWTTETLNVVTPSITLIGNFTLNLDANGAPCVLLTSWQANYFLQRQGPAQWSWEALPASVLQNMSTLQGTVLSPSGDFTILLTQSNFTGNTFSYQLCQLTRAAGTWGSVQVLLPLGSSDSSLQGATIRQTPSASRLAICFQSYGSGEILLFRDQGIWTTTTIGPSSYYNYPPLAGFDGNGKLHLLLPAASAYNATTMTYVAFDEAP